MTPKASKPLQFKLSTQLHKKAHSVSRKPIKIVTEVKAALLAA
jgi:hypothetical protein